MSISAGMLSAGFSFWSGLENWLIYGLFSFTATFIVYNGQRLFKADEMQATPWLVWVINHKKIILILIIVATVLAIVFIFFIGVKNFHTILLFIVMGLISMFYVVRIRGRNLREIPHIKIHLISLSWVAILILMPAINEAISEEYWSIALAFYLYVLAVTIPFDIRDLKYDNKNQRTFPQVIGVQASKFLSIILLIAFYLILLWRISDFDPHFIVLIATLLTIVLIAMMNERRSDFYCAGIIDGVISILGLSFFL